MTSRQDALRLACQLGLLLAAPLAAEGQQGAKVPRIGYVGLNSGANPHLQEAFRQGLRGLGYVEGQNVVIEYRDAEGAAGRSGLDRERAGRCGAHHSANR